jgi:hypothetical protein
MISIHPSIADLASEQLKLVKSIHNWDEAERRMQMKAQPKANNRVNKLAKKLKQQIVKLLTIIQRPTSNSKMSPSMKVFSQIIFLFFCSNLSAVSKWANIPHPNPWASPLAFG